MITHLTINLVKIYTASFARDPTERVKRRIKRHTVSCSDALCDCGMETAFLNWSWPRISSPPNSGQRADKLEGDDRYQVWVRELLTSNVKDVPPPLHRWMKTKWLLEKHYISRNMDSFKIYGSLTIFITKLIWLNFKRWYEECRVGGRDRSCCW